MTKNLLDILSEKYSSYEMGKGLGPTNDMSFIKTLIICGNSSILYFLKNFNEVTLSPSCFKFKNFEMAFFVASPYLSKYWVMFIN